jgi:hypothetical protein
MYDEYRLAWANIEGWTNQRRREANAGRDKLVKRHFLQQIRIVFCDSPESASES